MERVPSLPTLNSNYIKSKQSYEGDLDGNCREGRGTQTFKANYFQKYEGDFFHDNIHGHGKYTYLNKDRRFNNIYEGNFFGNCLEGYGRVYINENTYFEGSFKNNVRYGVGVYTYSDGTQDVGFWYGDFLTKVIVNVYPEWIPKLAKSSIGKVKLLKFKRLIPVYQKITDKAKEILMNYTDDPELLDRSDELYNKNIKELNSSFFSTRAHLIKLYEKIEDNVIIEVLSPECWSNTENDKKEDEINREKGKGKRMEKEDAKLVQNFEIKNEEVEIFLDEEDERRNDQREIKENEKSIIQDNLAGTFLAENFEGTHVDEDTHILYCKQTTSLDRFIKNLEGYLKGEDNCECGNKFCGLSYSSIDILLNKNMNDFMETIDKYKSSEDLPTKEIRVDYLLTKNNDIIDQEWLKLAFKYRYFENNVSFSVNNVMRGDRRGFKKPGSYEKLIIHFLKYASDGKYRMVEDIIYKNDLNPDCCDNDGNTGKSLFISKLKKNIDFSSFAAVHFAAARDRTKVIIKLMNYGANMNNLNDEGLTPLTMCFLRYIAVQNNIKNWEKAFLSEVKTTKEEKDFSYYWRPHVSLVSLTSSSSFSSYITSPMVNRSSLTSFDYDMEDKEDQNDLENDESKNIMLSEIENKLKTLQEDLEMRNFQTPYAYNEKEEQKYLLDTECKRLSKEKKKTKNEKKNKQKKSKGKKKKNKSDKNKNKSDKKKNSKGKKTKSKSSKKTKSSKKLKTNVLSNSSLASKDLSFNRTKRRSILKASHDTIYKESALMLLPTEEDQRLKIIANTIKCLLNCKCDPNEGEVPMHPIQLALFTKTPFLLVDLLNFDANPNVTTLEEGMTCIHILCCMEISVVNVKMLEILLGYHANTNLRTNIYHWYDENSSIQPGVEPVEGKTALQILSMRYDFINDNHGCLLGVMLILRNFGRKH